MQILVINLPGDEDRRLHVGSQLARLGLRFELVTGVCGNALTREDLARSYDDRKALRIQCRSLVRAEIGIALAHIAVYRTMRERGIPRALVLEDDVDVPDDLPEVLGALELELNANDPKVVLLSPASTDKASERSLAGRHGLARFRRGFYAHAYVVTQAAARSLERFLYPVADVADCWERLQRHRVVDVDVVVPAVVTQDQANFGSSSTIGILEAGIPRKLVQKVLFKSRRAFWLFLDWLLAQYHRRAMPYTRLLEEDK